MHIFAGYKFLGEGVTLAINIHVLLKKFISTTPLKPLNRISCNFIVKMDILCTCINLWNFFLREL